MTRRNVRKQGWVFPLFSPNSGDRLSLNFHRFVILYRSCDTRSVSLGLFTESAQWHQGGAPTSNDDNNNTCIALYTPGANFIELLKQKICLSTKIACLFYTCYWPKFHAVYIACNWYLAVVYLA